MDDKARKEKNSTIRENGKATTDMDDKARKEKNSTIRENGKATRLRHSSMRPVVVEMKLDLKCLNNSERDSLFLYFTQCRWLCNYLISLDADAFRSC